MSTPLATVATEFLERQGLAKSTIQSYELTLLPLLAEYGSYPMEILSRSTLNGLSHLAYTTHQRHQAIIQALFNFGVDQGSLKANPIAWLQRRKPNPERDEHFCDRVIRYLSLVQITQLYQIVTPHCRTNALVHLLHRTGARIAEILALNLADMNLNERKFQVIGKGNKTRWCFYSEDAANALTKYLQYYRHREHPALFTAQQPITGVVTRLSYWTAHQDWTRLIESEPELNGIRMHDLRHTFATERVGLMGIEESRALMGHTNLQTHYATKKLLLSGQKSSLTQH